VVTKSLGHRVLHMVSNHNRERMIKLHVRRCEYIMEVDQLQEPLCSQKQGSILMYWALFNIVKGEDALSVIWSSLLVDIHVIDGNKFT